MVSVQPKPVFRDLTAEDPEPEVTEIESLCMNCHKNGVTRLLLTRIPHYRNVVVMSFSCDHCGYENNELQPGGAYAPAGVRWRLQVAEAGDLDRQVVKSDHTAVRIPELDFEIPALSQKGEVTTVEGIVSRAIAGLSQAAEAQPPDAPLHGFLGRLRGLLTLQPPWTLELEDITGNTFVENPYAPARDPRCARAEFRRSRDQDHQLGIYSRDETGAEAGAAADGGDTEKPALLQPADPGEGSYERLAADEVLDFRTNCPDCNAPADTRMKLTRIPHFKEVVIMATVCEACGHRTNEVKSGGGVEPRGVRFEVRVAGAQDFSRDVLKAETCSLAVPELQLECGGHALGGRFTTVEGLLRAAADQLAAAAAGDAPTVSKPRLQEFLGQLERVLAGERAVTLVLDDPAGNSYVQSLSDDASRPDPGLKITRYERSFEQNEELGLNDMKVEGYQEEPPQNGGDATHGVNGGDATHGVNGGDAPQEVGVGGS